MRNELIIGGYSIDTIQDLDINITKEIYNIVDPSKRQSDFTKSVEIPGSKANDFVFKSLFDVNFSIRNTDQLNPDFNPSKKASCIYYQDTLQQITGYCQLDEIKVLNNDQVIYSITIYGKNIDIFSKLADKTLNDLTSLGTATWNDTEIVNSWTATYNPTIKLTYPALDRGLSKYGANGDARSNLSYNYNAFKPFLYIGHIFNAIFAEAGVSIEVSSFFNTAQWQKLILECDVTKFQLNQASVDASLVDGQITTGVNVYPVANANVGNLSTIFNSSQIKYSEVLDPSGQYNPTTGTFTKLGNGPTNFEVQLFGSLYNGSLTAGEVYFSLIRKSGSKYSVIDSARHNVSAGGTGYNTFFTPITIKVDSFQLLDGDEVRVCLSHKILTSNGAIDNTNIEYYPAIFGGDNLKVYKDGQIDYNVTFPICDILPPMKQTEFLMGIFKMFNLYMSPIYETGVVIEPRDIYFTNDIVDWTDLLDTSKDFTIKPQGLLENKELVFTYAENGDDLNKAFKQSTSFNFGYRDLIFDNEFVKETKKVEIPFCLIPLQKDDDKNVFMRTRFGGMSIEKSPKPIIAYFGGMKAGRLRYWNFNNTIATNYTTYPFAGHIDDLIAPNYDLAFDVQDYYFYTTPNTSGVTTTNNNLYNQFHKSQWEQIGNKDSKLIEAYFKLRPNDIANIDFRKTYWVKDNPYRLLTVEDYNPNGDTTTLCKLLKFAYQEAFYPTITEKIGGNGQGEKDGGYNTTTNTIKKGILATGGNVLNDNTNGIVVTGNGNNIGGDNANIVILGDNNTILSGLTDIVLINTSNVTITESGVQYIDNIKVDFGTPVNGYVVSYDSVTNSVKFTAPTIGGDMFKSVYDTDDDGIVDNAETINVIVRNSTGATLHRGKIVYLSGSTGNRPNAILAQANSEATSSGTFGVVMDNIANNSDGKVCAVGTLHNLDTRTTAPNPFTSFVLNDGDIVWLDPATAGYITNIKPSAPNHAVKIGYVARTHPTLGRIIYSIQNGFELQELHNVSINSVTNDQVLAYETATSLWKNKTITTLPSGIAGAVQFSNGSAFSSDASNFFWDDTNNRLGIGTNAPTGSLHIKGISALNTDLALRVESNVARMLLQVDNGGTTRISGATAKFLVGVETGGIGGHRLVIAGTSHFSPSGIGNAGAFSIDQSGTSSSSRTLYYDGSGAIKNLIQGNGTSYITSGSLGIGTTTATSILQVQGSGTTSATTSLSIQNSALTQLVTVRDDGNVGIGTATPQSILDVITPINGYSSFATSMSVTQYSGIHFGYRENNTLYRKSAIVFQRTDLTSGNAQGKIHILNGPQAGSGSATLSDSKLTINEIGNIGIGTTSPTARLQVQGSGTTSATTSLSIQNSALANLLTVKDDGSIQGLYSLGIGIGVASWMGAGTISTLNQYLKSSFNLGTNYGFKIINNGSSTSIYSGGDGSYDSKVPLYIGSYNGGATWMTLNTSGNVGIGTISPTARLQVKGSGATSATTSLLVENSALTNLLTVRDDGKVGIGTNTFVGSIKLAVNGIIGGPTYSGTYLDVTGAISELRGNSGIAYYSTAGNHTFYGGSSVEYMRLTTAGLLGIGTTSPGTRLDVVGVYDSLPARILRQATYGEILRIGRNGVSETASINYPADGVFAINTISTERLRVDASGNVGIGTTSPSEKLHVTGRIMSSGSSYTLNPTAPIFGQYSSTRGYIQVPTNGQFEIWTGGTAEIATFYENQNASFFGKVGIGTTTPTAKLDIVDTTLSGSGSLAGSVLKLTQTWNTTGNPTAIFANITNTASGGSSKLMDLQVGTVSQLELFKDGRLQLKNGTINAVGNNLNFRSAIAGGVGYVIDVQSYNTLNGSNNEQGLGSFIGTYAPTTLSGVPSFNALKLTPTINQTGTATGVTRGLYINPTLTSAPNFIAIETTVGNIVLGSTSGNLSIGTTSATAKVNIKGNGTTSATKILEITDNSGSNRLILEDGGDLYVHANTMSWDNQGVNVYQVASTNGSSRLDLNAGAFDIYDGGNVLSGSFASSHTGIVKATAIGQSTPPVPSAILEMVSTTQGLLPPRMTTIEMNAIPLPSAGLIVYDLLRNKLCCYDGTIWNDLF
jgi:hypothetical protein